MNRSNWCGLFVAMVLCVPTSLPAQTLEEEFVASGITRKVGGYRPIRSVMDKEAEIVEVAPDDLESPKYGVFEIGDQSWAYILDEREADDAKLYLDTNGDGDLTNDPEATWTSSTRGPYTMYNGSGEIDLGDERIGVIKFYRFDPTDERRASLKNTILYYTDFGYEYSFQLDGQSQSTFISGSPTSTTRFWIDRDRNRQRSSRYEQAVMGEPFNFTGTTYLFSLKEGKLSLDEADEPVEQLPMPPDLRIGKKALEFTATTMEGDEIEFPSHFAGKLVMLDFWATWCGPCIGEIPNMKEAYSDWNVHGFDILGISFDREDKTEDIEAFLAKNEQPWPQIYEGKGWETTLGEMYDVSGIPFVLLVDGDSGEIVATTRQLRGPGLSDLVQSKLQEKFDTELEPAPPTDDDDGEKPSSDEDRDGDEAAEKSSEE